MDKGKNRQTEYMDLGLVEFEETWDLQEKLFQSIIKTKDLNSALPDAKKKPSKNYLIICEHYHVYTMGKSGSQNNLLINHIQLQAKNASFFKINRGGDITYHGPGQIVAYPILDLEVFTKGVKDYISKLEEAVILMLRRHYDIIAARLPGTTGVWLDPETPEKTRKICAIGVRTSKYVSMHGLALNVNTDLSYFDHINPCGFKDKAVTSISKEKGFNVSYKEAKTHLKNSLLEIFEMELI